MRELKLSDPIKSGYYAYHVTAGKIDDEMRLGGGYLANDVNRVITDGWSFVARTKKYKKGQKASIPKCQILPKKAAPPKYVPPPKLTGVVLINSTSEKNGISCMSMRGAYDKLLNAMTKQDQQDFLNGKLCLIMQIIQTPEQFKPSKNQETA